MPELPEVETVGRGIAAKLLHCRVTHVWLGKLPLRRPLPKKLAPLLVEQTLLAVERRAKYLLLRFTAQKTLIVHLGMSGRMTIADGPQHRQRHDHMVITFADGQTLTFNDARRFGVLELIATSNEAEHPLFSALGPEPLEAHFTPTRLTEQLQGRKTPLKVALLDQHVVVGVGNIYASEALFRAQLSPERSAGSLTTDEAKKLTASIKAVLNAAIAAGGSSLRDYVQSDGELGYFQHAFKVYGREGQPCPRCKTPILRITQAGRSTFYCPTCQS